MSDTNRANRKIRLTEDDVAAIARVRPRTVKSWRDKREGPPWVSVGRTALYRHEALLTWLAAQEGRGAT